jgi:EAL domain-containing protein (putative c-di-GMP-specific phosphodiesterase class I)
VLTDQIDDTALAGLARRLLTGLAAPFVVDGRELWATASIGIATGGTEDEMLRNADLAMYEAKARGGNSFAFYAAELHEAAERRLGLLADLRRPELFDEFHLVYQPTFDLRRGHVEGLEALLRWEHPSLGLVSPAEFIPVAEDSGAIVEIGRWVLRTACREAARWPNRSGSFTLAVNVSGRQLREPGFMDDVRAALVESGLEPEALRLELTESVLVHASESARENVAAAASLGIQLAIDDFGTGHSWIGHLQEFAPDIVKIDRSFLAELDSGDSPVLRGTLALARELGVRVVAEGIERAEQLHAVRRLGCEIGQGFLLSVPLSAGDAAALIERGPIPSVAGLRLV